MNKIMKIFAILLLVFASFGASAQGCPNGPTAPVIMGQGYQGGNPCWGGQPLTNGAQFLNGAQYSPEMALLNSLLASQAGRLAPGGGLNKCEIVGAIAGGTLGSLAKNHTGQATILASLFGGAIGSAYCESQRREALVEAAQIAQLQAQVRAQQQNGQNNQQNQGYQPLQPVNNNVHNCEAGTSWRQLDWQGHPAHGQYRCLPSEEIIRMQKAAFEKSN